MQALPSKTPGQQEVIAQLYERHWLTILLAIRQNLPSQEDAEDILLDTFLAAFESDVFYHLVELQQIAWLRRTASNKAVDYHRRNAREPVTSLHESEVTGFEDEERSPEKSFLRHEEHLRLQSHIASLSELQQEILYLRFASGLRCTEIAAHMQKNEGTVRSLLSRTLNLLRSLYETHQE